MVVLFIFIGKLPVHILHEQNMMSYNIFVAQLIPNLVHEKLYTEITSMFEYESWVKNILLDGMYY